MARCWRLCGEGERLSGRLRGPLNAVGVCKPVSPRAGAEERWRGGGQVNAGLAAGRGDLKASVFCSVQSLTEGVDEVLPFKRFSFPLTDLKRCVLLALLST